MSRKVLSVKKNDSGHDDPQRRQRVAVSSQMRSRSVVSSSERYPQQARTFVDARRLSHIDFVNQTLHDTSGPLGVVSRPKIIDFQARRKERKEATVRTIVLRVLYGVCACVVLIAIFWVLFWSPLFRLRAENITIEGANEWVSKQKIASIVANQVDKSLFLVASGDVIEQLNNIPGVTHTTIDKQFPQGLRIRVQAQRPAAMLKVKTNGTLTAVDAQVRVLNAVNRQVSIKGIPIIEVASVEQALSSRAVRAALRVVSSLPESLRSQVTRVSATTQDSIETLLGSSNRVIIWGDASDLALKKAIVESIIADSSKIGDKRCLDVSAPARPIMK